jgi:hypothetical protein
MRIHKREKYEYWFENNYEVILETYNKICEYICVKVDIYSPLFNLSVNYDNLFDSVAKYMYNTSNNAYKHYLR